MYPNRPPNPMPPNPQHHAKEIISELCDRIKNEYTSMYSHIQSLKNELDKANSQRADYERYYTLNQDMNMVFSSEAHKMTDVIKRLVQACMQQVPFLPPDLQSSCVHLIEQVKHYTSNEPPQLPGPPNYMPPPVMHNQPPPPHHMPPPPHPPNHINAGPPPPPNMPPHMGPPPHMHSNPHMQHQGMMPPYMHRGMHPPPHPHQGMPPPPPPPPPSHYHDARDMYPNSHMHPADPYRHGFRDRGIPPMPIHPPGDNINGNIVGREVIRPIVSRKTSESSGSSNNPKVVQPQDQVQNDGNSPQSRPTSGNDNPEENKVDDGIKDAHHGITNGEDKNDADVEPEDEQGSSQGEVINQNIDAIAESDHPQTQNNFRAESDHGSTPLMNEFSPRQHPVIQHPYERPMPSNSMPRVNTPGARHSSMGHYSHSPMIRPNGNMPPYMGEQMHPFSPIGPPPPPPHGHPSHFSRPMIPPHMPPSMPPPNFDHSMMQPRPGIPSNSSHHPPYYVQHNSYAHSPYPPGAPPPPPPSAHNHEFANETVPNYSIGNLSGIPNKFNSLATLSHHEVVCSASFSNPSGYAFTGARGRVIVWDVSDPFKSYSLTSIECLRDNYVRSCKALNKNKLLVVCGEYHEVSVWSLNHTNPGHMMAINVCNLENPAPVCYDMAVTNDNKRCYVCCSNGSIFGWDIEVQKIVSNYNAHNDGATCIAVSNETNIIWTGGLDGTVRSFDERVGKIMNTFTFPTQVFSLSLSPQNDYFLAGLENKTIELFHLKNTVGRFGDRQVFKVHDSCVLSVKISHNGRWFLSSSKDNSTSCARLPGGQLMFHTKESSSVLCSDISPDDKYVITGAGDKKATLYECIYTC